MERQDERGRASGRSGPLRGYRVVEMEGVGPGPFAAMWLADMGADVIRISRPGQRHNQTRKDILNRGRRSLALDIKKPGATEIVLRLVTGADVLIEGYRPGVMERLGLGPQACHERAPGLVYGRITGWGREGPLAPFAGHDINYISVTGVLDNMGPGDGPPMPPLNLVGDFGGGSMFLVTGILAALWERERSGRGQVVDAAIVDGTSVLAQMQWSLRAQDAWHSGRGSNLLDGSAPFYTTYACADGRYVAVGPIEPKFFAALLAGLQLDPADLPGQWERDRWGELRTALTDAFADRTRDEWAQLFFDTDACVTPVLTYAEAAAHPHLRDREAFVQVDGVTQPAPAPRLSRTPAPRPQPSTRNNPGDRP